MKKRKKAREQAIEEAVDEMMKIIDEHLSQLPRAERIRRLKAMTAVLARGSAGPGFEFFENRNDRFDC